MANAHLLNLRLFLEGIEVPVVSANVTQVVGAPATAQIQVIPDPTVLRLAPRTMVHLFVKNPATRGTSDEDYVLLFSGDLTSIGYDKSSSSRNATLVCTDDSSYLDMGYLYFQSQADIEGGTSIHSITRERAAFIGAQTGFTSLAPSSVLSVVTQVFDNPTPKSLEFADAKGLLGVVLSLIEKYTGIDDIDRAGANQYFTFHASRKRLLAQIGAISDDRTADKILGAAFITDFIKQKADQLGQLVTARQLISYILEFIYYRTLPCTSPYYKGAGTAIVRSMTTEDQTKVSALGTLKALIQTGLSADDLETDNSAKPAYDKLNSVEQQSIKSFLQTSNVDGVITYINSLTDGLQQRGSALRRVDTSARLYTTLLLPDLYFASPPACNVLYPDLYTNFSYSREISSEPTRLHLTTQIDAQLFGEGGEGSLVYYAPSLEAIGRAQSHSAATLRSSTDIDPEVQRTINGRLFDHELYTGVVPAFSRVDRLAYMVALTNAKSGQVDRLNLTADQKSVLRNKQSASGISVAERDDFFLRIANGHYIRKRLEKRRGRASGILNPFAVVGLPMIVIDGYPVTGAGDRYSTEGEHNEHYIGVLQSVSHSVTQEGAGSTSYDLGFVRPHRGKDDDFLRGLALRPVSTTQGMTEHAATEAYVLLRVALKVKDSDFYAVADPVLPNKEYTLPKFPGSLRKGDTYHGMSITLISVTPSADAPDPLGNTRAQREEQIKQKGMLVYVNELIAAIRLPVANDKKTIAIKAANDGVDNLTEAECITLLEFHTQDCNGQSPFPFVDEVTIYTAPAGGTAAVNVPIEESIRPKYIDDIYASPLIGERVYTPLLGIGSVHDVAMSAAAKQGKLQYTYELYPSGAATKTTKSSHALEDIVDVLAGAYGDFASHASSVRALRSIKRPIATIKDLLGEGGFHDYAWTGSKSAKPLPLLAQSIYDDKRASCPPGYRKATPAEVQLAESKLNPQLDVREARHKLVLEYASKTRNRGRLG